MNDTDASNPNNFESVVLALPAIAGSTRGSIPFVTRLA